MPDPCNGRSAPPECVRVWVCVYGVGEGVHVGVGEALVGEVEAWVVEGASGVVEGASGVV